MNLETLMKIIKNAGGDEYIFGFIFDNIGRKLFIDEHFNLDKCLVPGTEVLKFKESDHKGKTYYSYKPIELIQSIMTVEKVEDKKKLDRFYTTG